MAHGIYGNCNQFFITGLSVLDILSTSATLRITDFGLDLVAAIQGLSPRRFVELKDFSIEPGSARGLMLAGGTEFQLDYAWAGMPEWAVSSSTVASLGCDKGTASNRVLEWRVRVRGPKNALRALFEAILIDEFGDTHVAVPRDTFLTGYMKCKEPTVESFRVRLQEMSDRAVRRAALGKEYALEHVLTPEQIEQQVAKMAETESLSIPLWQIREIHPWQLADGVSPDKH